MGTILIIVVVLIGVFLGVCIGKSLYYFRRSCYHARKARWHGFNIRVIDCADFSAPEYKEYTKLCKEFGEFEHIH